MELLIKNNSKKTNLKPFLINFFIIFALFFTYSCSTPKFLKPSKVDGPVNAKERARKNVTEGRGVSLGGVMGKRGTNYEFSTSNPLWRASLETIDFMPLSTVDYSGGIIITDWYSESNSDESIKITIRFLSNEIRPDNLKIIVHKKRCASATNCTVSQLGNNEISDELLSSIIKTAAVLEKEDKKKTKKK